MSSASFQGCRYHLSKLFSPVKRKNFRLGSIFGDQLFWPERRNGMRPRYAVLVQDVLSAVHKPSPLKKILDLNQ